MNNTKLTREEWLQTTTNLIVDEIITPVWKVRRNLKIKTTNWYCREDNKKVGICYPTTESKERYNQILIKSTTKDSLLVLGTLCHEVIHAIDDCIHGHKYEFEHIARLIGLEGNITTTEPGKRLTAKLKKIINLFGPIPSTPTKPKTHKTGVNRNIKVFCMACGFKFNTSRKQITVVLDKKGQMECPGCDEDMDWEKLA